MIQLKEYFARKFYMKIIFCCQCLTRDPAKSYRYALNFLPRLISFPIFSAAGTSERTV